LSYSFAWTWTTGNTSGGWWRNATDASLPLMSDMAPMNNTGPSNAKVNLAQAGTNPRLANSFVHQRDGQNVGYGDAHAEFARTPIVGQSNDNIFTGNNGTPGPVGTGPTNTGSGASVANGGSGGGAGAWDIVMAPVWDADNAQVK